MSMVALRTGVAAYRPLVQAIVVALRDAFDGDPWTFVGAVELAHTGRPTSRFPGLETAGFTQDGVMPDGVREIVLAATEGRGLAAVPVSPLAVPEPAGVVIPRDAP